MKKMLLTDISELKYVAIKGEGVDTAYQNNPPKMMFKASLCMRKGSPVHKKIQTALSSLWKEAKKSNPDLDKTPRYTGLKDEKIKGNLTGNVLFLAKTNVKTYDGKPNVVRLKLGNKEITEEYAKEEWTIDRGTTGRLYVELHAYESKAGSMIGTYLKGVALDNLIKYESNPDIPDIPETKVFEDFEDEEIPF